MGESSLAPLDDQFFSGTDCRFVRYDERGCGMTEWNTSAPVVRARIGRPGSRRRRGAASHGPFTLLGISQGAAQCIRYASPSGPRLTNDSVRRLRQGVGSGGTIRCKASANRLDYRHLTRAAWGHNNPVFRQIFTSRFVPEASDEQMVWFNDLCLKTASGETAADVFESRSGSGHRRFAARGCARRH